MRLAAYQPDIPQNLGAMIRLCACFGVPLDVIEPCAFPFSVKQLRRVAMDYQETAQIVRHADWDEFCTATKMSRIVLLSTKSTKNLWEFKFKSTDTLLVGRESAGVPENVHAHVNSSVILPMPGGGRSMNVTMSAGIALSEALRQVGHWTQRSNPGIK